MSQPMPALFTDWNNFFNLAITIALIALAIVIGAMVFFIVKYREAGKPRSFQESMLSKSRARDSVVFAAISIIILVSLVAASYRMTPNARFQPPSAQSGLNVKVKAFQWAFTFTYPNNVTLFDQLNLPSGTPVMFNVTSSDVMHNFYLVDFRVSIEAIPGRYNILWITTPVVNGNQEFNSTIECKELCGAGHASMHANLTVMNSTAFNSWLASAAASGPMPTMTPAPSSAGG